MTEALERTLSPGERWKLRSALEPYRRERRGLIRDLGGHDLSDRAGRSAGARRPQRPADGDLRVHDQGLRAAHRRRPAQPLGPAHRRADRRAARDLSGSSRTASGRASTTGVRPGALCAEAAAGGSDAPPRPPARRCRPAPSAERPPAAPSHAGGVRPRAHRPRPRRRGVGERIVTTAPDVSVSTNLGGWINRSGVFGPDGEPDVEATASAAALAGRARPGRHVELGISEMNLFLLLSQLGLTEELMGELLLPVGTVYDPFVCRGLDALIYAAVLGRPVRAGGHAVGHQPVPRGRRPPVDDHAVDRAGAARHHLRRARLRRARSTGCCATASSGWRADERSLYLRLSTKPVDQLPFEALVELRGAEAVRGDVVAGRLLAARLARRRRDDRRRAAPWCPRRWPPPTSCRRTRA